MRAFAYTVCITSLVCSVLYMLLPHHRTRKIASFVIGVFIIAALCVPLKEALSTLKGESLDVSEYSAGFQDDYAYIDAVTRMTTDNLVTALDKLLQNEGIQADNIIIGVRVEDDGGIYVNKADIYISKTYEDERERIAQIVYRNLSKEPRIIVNEEVNSTAVES